MARLREFRIPLLLLGVAAVLLIGAATTANKAAQPQWAMNASIIEACSCPMFCQCYFNPEPAAHAEGEHAGHGGGKHYCKFNNAIKVNHGNYGATKLDGAKFWVSGDLGGDFSKGQQDRRSLAGPLPWKYKRSGGDQEPEILGNGAERRIRADAEQGGSLSSR